MNSPSENTVRQTEKFYREFIRQNEAGICRIEFDEPIPGNLSIDEQIKFFDRTGFIAECNNSFSNYSQLICDENLNGKRIPEIQKYWELVSEQNIRAFFASDYQLTDFETQLIAETADIKYFSNSLTGIPENGKLVCVWATVRDITVYKKTEQASVNSEKYWQQGQKIEALGRLAGGIAHDFNNFLAVMVLHNDLLNLQLPANSPLRHRTDEMKTATNNAAAMIRQLLAIGRKQTIHPQPVELNKIIQEFSNILPSVITENIKVKTNLGADSGVCFVDQNRLIQALISLVVNAKEAMPKGGILTIETANVILDRSNVRHQSQPEGSFAQITIADNGIGMDSITLESVFEPFFSTKKSAKGVGLGLATVYGFVKQSKGFIWVESELNCGTTLKIQFPRIDQPKPEENRVSAEND